MRYFALAILLIPLYSCIDLSPKVSGQRSPASISIVNPVDQRPYLKILENKYRTQKRHTHLEIVHSMMKANEKALAEVGLPLKEITLDENINLRSEYRALELTIEHLAHKNSFHSIP